MNVSLNDSCKTIKAINIHGSTLYSRLDRLWLLHASKLFMHVARQEGKQNNKKIKKKHWLINIGKAGFPPLFFSLYLIIIRVRGKKKRTKSGVSCHCVPSTRPALKPGGVLVRAIQCFLPVNIVLSQHPKRVTRLGYKFFTWMGRPNSSRTKTVTSTFLLDDFPPRSKSPRSITKYKSFL